MPEYLSPGVYVEEVDRGPKPIEGVGTAMAAFVGFTEKAELVREVDGEMITEDLLNRAQLVTNWTQYVERFGGFVDGAYMPLAVYGYFHNGGTRCYVMSLRTIGKAQAPLLGGDGKPHLIVKAKQAGFDGMRLRVKVDVAELPAAPAPKAAKGEGKKEGEEGAKRGCGRQPAFHHHRRKAGHDRRLAGQGSGARYHPDRAEGGWRQEGRGGLQGQPGAAVD